MSKNKLSTLRLLSYLLATLIAGILGNIVASGLESQFDLVTNQVRWYMMMAFSVVVFLFLIWYELRNKENNDDHKPTKIVSYPLISPCPHPPDYFTGRENELDQITISLNSCQRILVWGMGGVGKTTLASVFFKYTKGYTDGKYFVRVPSNIQAERPVEAIRLSQILYDLLREKFNLEELRTLCFSLSVDFDDLKGGGKSGKARELVQHFERHDRIIELKNKIATARPNISWPDLSQSMPLVPSSQSTPRIVEEILKELAKILKFWDPNEISQPDIGVIKIDLTNHFAAHPNALIILDNVSDEKILPELMDTLDKASILITSRRNLESPYLSDNCRIKLEVLAKEESETLLQRTIGENAALTIKDEDKEAMDILVTIFGGLPLVIELFGNNFRKGYSVRKWLDSLQDPTQYSQILTMLDDEKDAKSFKIFEEVYKLLTEAERELFLIVGFFADKAFTRALVLGIAETVLKNEDALVTLSELQRRAIFNIDDGNKQHSTFLLHSMLKRFVDYKLRLDEKDKYMQWKMGSSNLPDFYISLTTKNPTEAVDNLEHIVNMAAILCEDGDWQKAINYSDAISDFLDFKAYWPEFRQVKTCTANAAKQIGEFSVQVKNLIEVARLYRYQNNYEMSTNMLEQVLRLANSNELPLQQAEAYKDIAWSKRRAGEWDSARQYLWKAVDLIESRDDGKLLLAECYVQLGNIEADLGRSQASIYYLKKAEKGLEAHNILINDYDGLAIKADILHHIANVYFYRTAKFAESSDVESDSMKISGAKYQEALEIIEPVPTPYGKRLKAFFHDHLGQWYYQADDLQKAKYHGEQSMQLFTSNGERDGVGFAHDHLGEIDMSLAQSALHEGNRAKALEHLKTAHDHFEDGVKIFDRIRKRDAHAWLLHHLGEATELITTEFRESTPESAEQIYSSSFEIFKELNMRDWMRHLQWHISDCHLSRLEHKSFYRWIPGFKSHIQQIRADLKVIEGS